MRVLLLPFPAKAHVFSMVPLGWALRAAGHDVCFAAQPNPSEAGAFRATGLDTMWVGDGRDLAEGRRRNPDDAHGPLGSRYRLSEPRAELLTDDYVRGVYELWVRTFQFLAPRRFVDDLVAFARQWRPDLVVWDPIMYAGPVAAAVVGVPSMRLLFAVDQWARLARRHLDRPDPLADWLDGLLAPYGLGFEESMRYGQATIDPNPQALCYRLGLDYLPVRFVPFNGRSTVPGWVLEPPGRPRVCVTLGVSNREVHGHEEASVAALLGGVAGLDVEVIATFTAAQLAAAGRVPDNVRVVDFVPLNDLLPSCAAIVHQGGGGTIGNAAAHGVPQLIVPGTTWGEQSSAHLLAEHGSGLVIELAELTAETLHERLGRMLTEPSFRARAAELRDELLATPSPADLVAQLEASLTPVTV